LHPVAPAATDPSPAPVVVPASATALASSPRAMPPELPPLPLEPLDPLPPLEPPDGPPSTAGPPSGALAPPRELPPQLTDTAATTRPHAHKVGIPRPDMAVTVTNPSPSVSSKERAVAFRYAREPPADTRCREIRSYLLHSAGPVSESTAS
jgi:hypothetical protein